jgi:transporter family-2 protein
MTGQTVAALLLDHFGLLGNPRTEASPLRLIGAGLLITGVLVIVQAKRLEHRQTNQASVPQSEDSNRALTSDKPSK